MSRSSDGKKAVAPDVVGRAGAEDFAEALGPLLSRRRKPVSTVRRFFAVADEVDRLRVGDRGGGERECGGYSGETHGDARAWARDEVGEIETQELTEGQKIAPGNPAWSMT